MNQPTDFDDYDELEALPIRHYNRQQSQVPRKASRPEHKPKVDPQQILASIVDEEEDQEDFIKTYKPSRFERPWIIEALGGFYHQHWITDILRQVKGGKEASVYLCAGHPSASQPYLAAKVYRPRHFRNLRNDHLYREGRTDLDDEGHQIVKEKQVHAIQKKTEYGRELLHSSWIAYELQAMQTLYAAGAAVPAPYGRSHNAILMDYLGDPDFPAPILNSVTLEPSEARRLFKIVVENIELMLSNELIHADLSAYNILYWQGRVWLIDFPQVVAPGQNRSAFRIFERDVTRVCEYFNRMGLNEDPAHLARDLWRQRGLRLRPEVHPRLLDDQDEGDYAFWQHLQDE
jgi:RIO kinase 1